MAASLHDRLAEALLAALRAQPWNQARDRRRGGLPFTHPPSIDLAVAVLPSDAPPAWANVLMSREHPQGFVARIGDDAGPVQDLAFLADPVDAAGVSVAWQPGADWSGIAFAPLYGSGTRRFVAPYPASLVKLMVAVAVARLCDAGRAAWDEPWRHGAVTQTPAQWCEPMLTVSDNDATDALVALLHARGAIGGGADGRPDAHHEAHALFAAQGLPTLRLARTTPAGGWRNADGSGVGALQMTAWDTVRLLWRLLDVPAPWLPPGSPPMLTADSRQRMWRWLCDQQLNEVLSSRSLVGVPGWRAGIDVGFAHKTGTTETYASDAGLFMPRPGLRVLVAVLTTLGRCAASDERCATDWCVPALGAAMQAAVCDIWR
ncbi:MAG: serine hydrolase [Aquabacterium sp.]